MEAESQNKLILEHLQKGKSITSLEALSLCGSLRLSARIYDLRDKGYDIKTEMIEVNGKRVARYYLPYLRGGIV